LLSVRLVRRVGPDVRDDLARRDRARDRRAARRLVGSPREPLCLRGSPGAVPLRRLHRRALMEDAKKRRALIGVMLTIFLAAMESTVVATAMPTVVKSLGGIHMYSWVFSGFLLTSTVTMPLWGRLSDLFGRRR